VHKLLSRQLRRHLGIEREEDLPDELRDFLRVVSTTYQQSDEDRRMVERSLSLTSKELNERNQELARSNADLRQFTYVVSHDLQEPLRSVTGYAQLLARRYRGQLDPRADELIEGAVDGARRMQVFIRDLLAYSRIGFDRVQLVPTAMETIRDHALSNLAAAIEEAGAAIESDSLPVVVGDPNQLVQLLQNLIGNSLKFRRDEPPRVRLSAERDGPRWRFAVADNGIGIPDGARDRVFQIFQRLHPMDAYPGTGIGLAIASRIVERHQGRIWIESEVGKGATFWFSLPAEPEA
jgi:light-regulated signal transduction histidine kinase (bacteriophytochrome)